MGSRTRVICSFVLLLAFQGRRAEAQWKDPKLVATQVGFHVAVGFVGKLIVGEPPGRALKAALADGALSGSLAHVGYCIGGNNPEWALVGKALSQKASLSTNRSFRGDPVFDRTLLTHWELTHSFVNFQFHGRVKPRVRIDAVNASFSAYYLLAGDPYHLDSKRSLLSGSLVFENRGEPDITRGFYLPGVIWIREGAYQDRSVWGHEVIHSFQIERGPAIHEVELGAFRINWLAFTSGVPAFLSGWPEHDTRWHEREADRYAGTGSDAGTDTDTDTDADTGTR